MKSYSFAVVSEDNKPIIYSAFGDTMIEAIMGVYKNFYVKVNTVGVNPEALITAISKKLLTTTNITSINASSYRIEQYTRKSFAHNDAVNGLCIAESFFYEETSISLETFFEYLAKGLAMFKADLIAEKF